MSHLLPERLAALADAQPTAAEAAHLSGCSQCAGEREAFIALLELSQSEQVRLDVPISDWQSIHAALHRDRAAGRRAAWWRQAVAAVALMAVGIAAGRYSAGATPLLGFARAGRQQAHEPPDTGKVTFASLNAAWAAQAKYEELYQGAAEYIAAHDSAGTFTQTPAAMRTRLAALDRVDRAMRDAMREAPYDPVINGYYLTTLGQREATLRQLNTVLPAGMRIDSY